MDRGSGCRLWDVDGNCYLDVLNNYTSLIHGHAHPAVVQAVAKQIAMSSAPCAPTESQITLADLICERVHSLELVRFCNSGTEAVLNAIRAARALTGRSKILKMEGGYHGTYDPARVSVHPGPDAPPYPQGSIEQGVSTALGGEVLVVPFNDVETFENVFQAYHQQLAAVIVEPMMGSAGMIPAEASFLETVRALTSEKSVLLIFDEVLTLRLAEGGLQSIYGVKPDITTMGKIIGGGLPIGAFGGRGDVMALFDPRAPRFIDHAGTFNGNPVTMVAGIATLEAFGPEENERINRLGDRLRSRLAAVIKESGVPAQVTGLGSLAQVHFTSEPVKDYRSAEGGHHPIWPLLHLALLNHGLVMAPRGMLALSTAMSEPEVEEAVVTFGQALEQAKQGLVEAATAAG
jgi:glutamate-1-semialdehyde 2,1-aminomutase